MNNLSSTTRFLKLSNITLESFQEKITGDYTTTTTYKNSDKTESQVININFSWGEVETYNFTRRNNKNEHIEVNIKYIKPKLYTISLNSNALDISGDILPIDEIVKSKYSIVTLLEKNNDLLLLIKGGNDEQSKIRHKLLGGHGSNAHAKRQWNGVEILNSDKNKNIYQSDFLLWLISKVRSNYVFSYSNLGLDTPYNDLKFRITDIISILDNGISKQVKRKGAGANLLNDPIVKAIIAGVDNISGLGFSITYNNHNVIEFILGTDGCIEILDTCIIGFPTIQSNHNNYFEVMTYIIYQEILPLLLNEFEQDTTWITVKHQLKLDYCIQTTEALCNILGIPFINSATSISSITQLEVK
ncbi:hypothetical protein [Cetobacterium somerae]|uniref:hypothetical protein n=1 Tax=Cetobacterium TaxID=180162 RepID=UPI0038911A3C